MTSERQFDALLRSWLEESAPSGQPQDLLESVLTATGHTRPRPAWQVRLLGEPMPETGRPGLSRFAPLALAGTAIVVALVIGIGLFLRSLNVGPSPAPSGHPSPSELAGPSAGPTSSVVPGPAGVWIATGTMGTPRSGHTAVRLLDGRVLVAGGSGANNDDPLTSAELYDPDSGTWSATGNTAWFPTFPAFPATLLRDGKVLVGVVDDPAADNPVIGAEVYDPTSGSWTATGKLLMSGRTATTTATLLRDGKVLVIGYDGSAELYDPGTGTWTATGELTTPRHSHAAILLPDGRVLVAGGHAPGDSPTDSAELYDPDTGSWTAIANMNAPRDVITATLLRDGTVLVVGQTSTSSADRWAELYDPATGAWTATGDMARPGTSYQTATLLSDGTVLVAGGVNGIDPEPPFRAAELYDPDTRSWTTTGTMLEAHVGSPATLLLDGRVLVAGGDDTPGSAQLYVPGSGQ